MYRSKSSRNKETKLHEWPQYTILHTSISEQVELVRRLFHVMQVDRLCRLKDDSLIVTQIIQTTT